MNIDTRSHVPIYLQIAEGIREAVAAWATDAPSFDRFMETGYAIICPVVAVVCFSIGTWYYLRRVEP